MAGFDGDEPYSAFRFWTMRLKSLGYIAQMVERSLSMREVQTAQARRYLDRSPSNDPVYPQLFLIMAQPPFGSGATASRRQARAPSCSRQRIIPGDDWMTG